MVSQSFSLQKRGVSSHVRHARNSSPRPHELGRKLYLKAGSGSAEALRWEAARFLRSSSQAGSSSEPGWHICLLLPGPKGRSATGYWTSRLEGVKCALRSTWPSHQPPGFLSAQTVQQKYGKAAGFSGGFLFLACRWRIWGLIAPPKVKRNRLV